MSENKIRCIDMHVHYGEKFPWLTLGRIYSDLYESVRERYDIDCMILSSTRAITYDMPTGNEELWRFIEQRPYMYGYIVTDPNRVGDSEREMQKYAGNAKNGKFVGVKVHGPYSNTETSSPRMEELFQMLGNFGLPVKIHSERLDQLEELARKFPALRIISAHGGVHGREMLMCIKNTRNVYVDFAASTPVHGAVDMSVEILGAERVLYGSDLPIMSPSSAMGMIEEADITPFEKELIMWKNAANLFGISGGLNDH